jgi:hypothetical protein
MGFATVELATLCADRRCGPAADLLDGLVCDQETTDRNGFTRTVGCGLETIELNGYGRASSYAATYDATSGELIGLKIQEIYPFGECSSLGYKAGTVRGGCAEETTYACRPVIPGGAAAGAYAGCRSADEDGCSQCCGTYQGYCNVWTASEGSINYDINTSFAGSCVCGCQPCAECSLEDERQLRLMKVRPECDCDEVPAGEPCLSYCSYSRQLTAKCPGIL